MKKKILFFFLGLFVLLTAAYFYINLVFIPGQFKAIVINKLQEALHRPVSLENLHYTPIKGFTITGLRIFDAQKADLLIQMDEASFNILLLPLITSKAVIIPTIRLTRPYVHLIREDAQTWNFSDLLPKGNSPAAKSSLSFIVRKIIMEDGTVTVSDRQLPDTNESLKNMNLVLVLSIDKKVQVNFAAKIPERQSTLSLKGTYDIDAQKFSADTAIKNLQLGPYMTFVTQPFPLKDAAILQSQLRIAYQNGLVAVNGDVTVGGLKVQLNKQKYIANNIQLSKLAVTWRDKKLNARADVLIPSADLVFNPNVHLVSNISGKLHKIIAEGGGVTIEADLVLDNSMLKVRDDKTLNGTLRGNNLVFTAKAGKFSLQGGFICEHPDFQLGKKYAVHGDLSSTKTVLHWGQDFFELESDLTANHADLIFQNRPIKGDVFVDKYHMTYEGHRLSFQASAKLDNADVGLTEQARLQGDPQLNVKYEYDSEQDKIDYQGTIDLTFGHLTGLPHFEEATNINGRINFKPDALETADLKFRTQEADVVLSGSLSAFADPQAHFKAKIEEMELSKLMLLVPEVKGRSDINYTGSLTGDLTYDGPINSPEKGVSEFTGELIKASIATDKFPDAVKDINGKVHYGKDLLAWEGLKAKYQGKKFSLEGKLTNFAQPFVTTAISSDHLDATLMANTQKEFFQIVSLKGNYYNSIFDLKGRISLSPSQPPLDMRGPVTVNLADLKNMVPAWKDKLHELELQGSFLGQAQYKGDLNNWRAAAIAADGTIAQFSVMGYAVDNVTIKYHQANSKLDTLEVAGKIYGGEAALTANADFADELLPVTADVQVKNVDLSNLQTLEKIKNKSIAGLLNLSLNLSGPVLDLNQINGAGSVAVTDGNIWQWTLIEGIWGILLIPEFKNVVFTDIQSEFTVGSGKLSTDNTQLKSDAVDLSVKGWIDTAKNINCEVWPKFSEITILKSKSSLKKGLTSFLLTGGTVSIKIDGSLDNPQYHVGALPIKVLQKTTGFIMEGIGGIFQEIF